MAWAKRGLGLAMIGISGWLVSGCAALPDWAQPKTSLAQDICFEPQTRVARAQTADPLSPPQRPASQGIGLPVIGAPTPLSPAPVSGSSMILPPPPPGTSFPSTPSFLPPAPLPAPPPPSPSGTIQVSLRSKQAVRISIRAWVNGHPIFDDEVMQAIGPDLRRLQPLPEPTRSEKLAETVNIALDHIIDSEVMYQEAIKRIEKAQPHMIDKLKRVVDEEYYKQADKMRKANVPESAIKEMEQTSKRMLERNLISTEYARSRIMDNAKINFSFQDIKDYYNDHLNEFRSVDKVIWQDIFIPIGPNLPKLSDAHRFAEELLARCRTAEDFNRLMVYNEGDSKLRNGIGLGQRRGEIRPPELEAIMFKLREGEIGPVVQFPTGVHLIRVTKREYEGQMPLDHAIQVAIKKKLEGQFMDREYKRIIHELRSRAVVSILKGPNGL